VKREANTVVGILYAQIGPSLKSLLLSMCTQPSVKELLQKCFDEHRFDPAMKLTSWSKVSLHSRASDAENGSSNDTSSLHVPRSDITTLLSKDIIARLVRSQILVCILLSLMI
jgi:hypothetical protein